ncbi:hypothetical protein OG828_20190 [Streptomyces sp. NBC_00457]|uniref:hypothetical protein n=1 Tax=Streptomyces sp. NBC_00457 TaxID=2975748 RepID=UPI002E1BF174
MSGRESYVGIEGGSRNAQQADRGLCSALLDALDLVLGHPRPLGQFRRGEPKAIRRS